jgi:serine/threonine protein kinase
MRRELGRGTMGVVYEAEDTVLARTVAVKTIELAFAADEGARSEFEQRFFTEARVAARLSHPGIVVCHDVGKDPATGKLFIVFEYLRGRTLADRAAEGPMDWREALGVVVQVARAIHHAHEHGVVHRDLKPANIMLLDPGTSGASAAGAEAVVKIMDFGVARLESLGQRLTRTGQSFGTPLYMSPEQALGQHSSARSDIFSVGSVLCTLLLGRPWFHAPSLPEIVGRLVHDDPPHLSSLRPELPPSLDAVLAMALA